ncbi:retrovirus-related Pol polyprotein from transposon 17.6 [Trichonephila clavipes]|nr:retrovirus-related Pol polyprotein from transposon 17.6 [Trichonephila clavipes]
MDSHRLCLLPPDIVQLISREPEEKREDYNHIKELLLRRFKLSPETFRLKFVQLQKVIQSFSKDFAFKLINYFEEWIDGIDATDYKKLKELINDNQTKRRMPNEIRFVNCSVKITSPTELANMLDEYDNVRRNKRPNSEGKL